MCNPFDQKAIGWHDTQYDSPPESPSSHEPLRLPSSKPKKSKLGKVASFFKGGSSKSKNEPIFNQKALPAPPLDSKPSKSSRKSKSKTSEFSYQPEPESIPQYSATPQFTATPQHSRPEPEYYGMSYDPHASLHEPDYRPYNKRDSYNVVPDHIQPSPGYDKYVSPQEEHISGDAKRLAENIIGQLTDYSHLPHDYRLN